uniref:C2H2-type domain-containing protein n=1 Tax=Strongyloides papillosus TaxID=174720 RepID=A0A0N5BUS8_STREA
MPSLRDEAKYYCPYCKETNYIEDQEFDVIQLKTHLEAFHGYSSKTSEKSYCQECLRTRALGDLRVNPKRIAPFWMIRHIQNKGCYKVPGRDNQQVNIQQEEQEEMLDTSVENTDMEVISQSILEENEEAEDNIFDDLIDLENIHNDPHK